MHKLTFVKESTIPGRRRLETVLRGETATELLDQWNELDDWLDYPPENFRQAVLELARSCIEPTPAEAQLSSVDDDETLLEAIVKFAGPSSLRLEPPHFMV